MENPVLSSADLLKILAAQFLLLRTEYLSYKNKRKIDKLSKEILEIINRLLDEDELYRIIDKKQLFEYLFSNIHILPHDITKEELTNRIRKIMAIEVMSKILD